MERSNVINYLNNNLHHVNLGNVTMDDTVMIKYLRAKKGIFTNQDDLIKAIRSTSPHRLEDFKSGVYSLLIKEFKVEVLFGQTMIINNISGEQVIGYK